MLYKILEPKLLPNTKTLLWKAHQESLCLEHVTDFCSPTVEYNAVPFFPSTGEDYDNVDWGKTMLINNMTYAQKIAAEYPRSRILGMLKAPTEADINTKEQLLGFDILDKMDSYSSITNIYLNLESYGNPVINQYALIDDMVTAYRLKDFLKKNFGELDWHAKYCEVWAIFKV